MPENHRAKAEPAPVWPKSSRAGDYTVVLYDSAESLLSFAARFIADGLAHGERCLCVVDESTPEAVTAALAGHGVDVARATARGALAFVSTRGFGTAGSLNAGRLMEHLRAAAAGTGLHSFTGVRIAAEMTWASRAPDTDDAIMAFDALFEAGIGRKGLTVAGMYPYGRFDPPTMRRLIHGHRHVLAPDHMYVGLSPIFQGLTEEARTALLAAAGERLVPKGRFFYNQGGDAAEVFVLTRGRAAFSRTDRDGRRVMSLVIGGPSDVFGYNSIIATTRVASALALDDSRALAWDIALFRSVITAHPGVAAGAIEYFIRQSVSQWQDLRILATERVEQRLARILQRLVESAGRRIPHGAVIEVALSGQDLAEMAATTPYTVSRIFATWRRRHLVDAHRDRIRIVDADRLIAIARADAEAEPSVG